MRFFLCKFVQKKMCTYNILSSVYAAFAIVDPLSFIYNIGFPVQYYKQVMKWIRDSYGNHGICLTHMEF